MVGSQLHVFVPTGVRHGAALTQLVNKGNERRGGVARVAVIEDVCATNRQWLAIRPHTPVDPSEATPVIKAR